MNTCTIDKLLKEHIFDSMAQNSLVVFVLDQNGKIKWLSEHAKAIYHWQEEDVIGKSFLTTCKKYAYHPPFNSLEQIRTRKKVPRSITHLHPTNTTEYTLEWLVINYITQKNKPFFLLVGRDVSQLLQKHEALLENLAYLENIINSIPYSLFWKNKQSVFLGCNKKFAETINSTVEEIVGKSDYDMPWSKKQSQLYQKDDQKVMDTGIPLLNYEETQRQLDTTEKVMMVSKVPFYDEDIQEIKGLIGIFTDITEQKRHEAELKQAKEAAEEANRVKSQFLAIVSHELRTPLTGIIGIANILKEQAVANKKASPAQKELLDNLLYSGDHLLSIINDILDFTKLEEEKLELSHARINLHELIEGIIAMLQHLAQQKNLKLLCKYEKNAPKEIIADERVLKQILINLVGNALKFTERGSITICVKCKKQTKKAASLQVQVIDTGIGIPKNKLDSVFEKFNQVDNSRSRRYGGTGLGLAITKAYIEAMDGKISVTSEPKKGTTFTCSFDVELPQRTTVSDEIHSGKALTGKTPDLPCRVLLVEDDLIIQKIHIHMLNKAGCHIELASDGDEAIKKIREGFDLVFMDIGLPDKDGYEIAKEIRKQKDAHALTPIIGLTGFNDLESKELALKAGMNELVVKPIEQKELAEIIKRWKGKTSAKVEKTMS